MKKYLPYINLLLIIIIGSLVYDIYQRDPTLREIKSKITSENKKPGNIIEGIAKVSDGDTIKIDNIHRIRLLSIDTPETKQTCLNKNNQEYFCGKMATDFLKKIAEGKVVQCFYEKKDIYNRFLGYCYLGEIFLNLEMVKNGMSVIYDHKKAGE